MPKTKKYSEVENIKQDIETLKSDTIELAKHIKSDSSAKVDEMKEMANDRIHVMTEQGKEQLKNVEKTVKKKPLQSLAIAFATGLAVSALMKRH